MQFQSGDMQTNTEMTDSGNSISFDSERLSVVDPASNPEDLRRSLLASKKASSIAAIKCCTTRRAFSDHDAVILEIDEDDEEDGASDDFETSLARTNSYSNRRRSNDSYASAYSTRGRRRSSVASTQSVGVGAITASGGRAARRRASRRMSTECHASLILDELWAMSDDTIRKDQQAKDKGDLNSSANTIRTAATSASSFRRPSLLASAIENNDFYQHQHEDLYAYNGNCIVTKLNRSMARDWDMSGNCPLEDQARRRRKESKLDRVSS